MTLSVYNTQGQQIATFVQADQESGYHEIQFNAQNLPRGVDFYRMHSGDFMETKKLLLVRGSPDYFRDSAALEL